MFVLFSDDGPCYVRPPIFSFDFLKMLSSVRSALSCGSSFYAAFNYATRYDTQGDAYSLHIFKLKKNVVHIVEFLFYSLETITKNIDNPTLVTSV